jgi:hypothetical protein
MNLSFINKNTEKLNYSFSVQFVRNMRKLLILWAALIVWNILWIVLSDASWRFVVFGALLLFAVLGFWWTTAQIKRTFVDDNCMHMQERLMTAFVTEVNEERRGRNA